MITYETKLVAPHENDFGACLKVQVHHRWRCTCGRIGVWLVKLTNVEANAAFHARWHLDNPTTPVHPTTPRGS